VEGRQADQGVSVDPEGRAVTVRSPEEYRAVARRIRGQMLQVDREDLRETMLEIARLYERMADQVEKVAKEQQELKGG
jgi:hypothetical protein